MTDKDIERIERYYRATQTFEPPKEGHDVDGWNKLNEAYRLGYNLEYFTEQAIKDFPEILNCLKEWINGKSHFDRIVPGDSMFFINPPGIEDKLVFVHSKDVFCDGSELIQISDSPDFSDKYSVLPSQLRFVE